MRELRSALVRAAGDDPLARSLVPVLSQPTQRSTAGFHYLEQSAWEEFRDRVPHILGMGQRTLDALERIEQQLAAAGLADEDQARVVEAAGVVRQIVLTAAITAPSDLWLLRHVLSAFRELGLLARLCDGDAIYPESCAVEVAGTLRRLDPSELDKDLQFLLSRGFVEQYDDSYRVSGHPRVREVLASIPIATPGMPASPTRSWRKLFGGQVLTNHEIETLLDASHAARRRNDPRQNHWIPDRDEVVLGATLLPIAIALRATELVLTVKRGDRLTPHQFSPAHPLVAAAALEVLTAAGWLHRDGESYCVTTVGARAFSKAPGPFGIIETYHPYMQNARNILLDGPSHVHVQRSDNVAASQDANRATFEQANAALDRFCRDTGFRYSVFIEHAIGRGEATRQRYVQAGDTLAYVGADLEDAAIDAAVAEQGRGLLPRSMLFVRNADIGKPEVLLRALRDAGHDPAASVMLVGNGFHEVRGQSDDSMAAIFAEYQRAGVVLLLTEETALSIDDLRATAWNTYHAGFKYVHDKSGQALRPADPSPNPPRLGRPMRAAWSECAHRAGYVRADAYCTRTRTIYPCAPRTGFNPSISVNHLFVPNAVAKLLMRSI